MKDEFSCQDDFDIRFGPDKNQKMFLSKQRPDNPVKLKIKFQYQNSGMKLDGYCFFAQKMRQLMINDNKKQRLNQISRGTEIKGKLTVGQILAQIKTMWEQLGERDKAEYEKKANEIRRTMKAQ